jgi:hypothetical protein
LLREGFVQRSRQAKPRQGQLAIEGRPDRREIIGAEMRVHRDARDRNVTRRLVRLERPVDRRPRIEPRDIVGGEPIGLEIVDIAAPIPKYRTDETDIPDNMQIGGYAIVLGGARE